MNKYLNLNNHLSILFPPSSWCKRSDARVELVNNTVPSGEGPSRWRDRHGRAVTVRSQTKTVALQETAPPSVTDLSHSDQNQNKVGRNLHNLQELNTESEPNLLISIGIEIKREHV